MAKETKTTTKRRVKDPVTFRERAVKATAASGRPTAKHRAAKQALRPLKAAVLPIIKTLKLIFNRKPFTFLRRPLRIIGKILVPPYLRKSWAELRLVTWLTWRQSIRLTIAVLIFAAIFGLMIAGIDYVLDKLFRQILID